MILFIEKAWFLWWMLAIVVVLRWFHLLSVGPKLEGLDVLASEEEDEGYILSWGILHKAQVMSGASFGRSIVFSVPGLAVV